MSNPVKQWFSRLAGSPYGEKDMTIRRWESADTDRLNEKHWSSAKTTWINQDIIAKLDVLRQRCAYEAANNPFVEGVINTHITDIVGANGPTLQIHSDDTAFSDAAEAVWRAWWRLPDINYKYSGADILAQWIRSCWVNGEYLTQMLYMRPNETSRSTLRLLNLDPRRLQTPTTSARGDRIMMGVERDANGRALAYYITAEPVGELDITNIETTRITAPFMLHGFRPLEPGQARGIPWLAPALQMIADMRDYDAQVLDAARAAADNAVLLTTKHEDAAFVEYDGSVEIERRTISTMPPGWEATQLRPEHPMVNYIEYRAERLREIGRMVSMPLMMVRLDSANHNYSSARFDAQVYHRSNAVLKAWLQKDALDTLARKVFNERIAAGELQPLPKDFQLSWTWPTAPHVDPTKEATAEKLRLANGTTTLTNACAEHGLDFEQVVEQRKKEIELLKAAGLYQEPAQTNGASSNEQTPNQKAT